MNEWDLIDRIEKTVLSKGTASQGLLVSIGDDCAVYEISDNRFGLFTTDISIENIHFDRTYCSWNDIGYKSMVSNISDITAMGGKPVLALVSLGITDDMNETDIDEIMSGMHIALEGTGASIAGGDISKSRVAVLNIALYGEKIGSKPLLRSSAKPGQNIFVTGRLGDSLAGLEILKTKKTMSEDESVLAKTHLRPESPWRVIDLICDKMSPGAMIDISDGLASDIRHICKKSSTGCLIDCSRLPFSKELKKYTADPCKYAFASGEEYQLLFTSESQEQELVFGNIIITRIGKITPDALKISTSEGNIEPLPETGYQHFS